MRQFASFYFYQKEKEKMNKTQKEYFENKRNLLNINKYQALEIFGETCTQEQQNYNIAILKQFIDDMKQEKLKLSQHPKDNRPFMSRITFLRPSKTNSINTELIKIISNNIELVTNILSKQNTTEINHDDIYAMCKKYFDVQFDRSLAKYLESNKHKPLSLQEMDQINSIIKESKINIFKKDDNSFEMLQRDIELKKAEYNQIIENLTDEQLENDVRNSIKSDMSLDHSSSLENKNEKLEEQENFEIEM